MVADGRFRQDLYYRISAFPIHLPPLRERVADIPMLVDSFLQRGVSVKHRVSVAPAAMALLQAHPWPGNLRELRNVLDRARLFADDGTVRVEHLPESLGCSAMPAAAAAPAPPAVPAGRSLPTLPRRGEINDEALRQLVQTAACTRKALALQAGLSERTLYRRLKALGLA
jgi:DNA-binding NtrC family response regulator